MGAPTDRWEMSGPEEGDTIDQRVFVCNHDFDGYEVIEIHHESLRKRKSIGRKIADLLNEASATLTT